MVSLLKEFGKKGLVSFLAAALGVLPAFSHGRTGQRGSVRAAFTAPLFKSVSSEVYGSLNRLWVEHSGKDGVEIDWSLEHAPESRNGQILRGLYGGLLEGAREAVLEATGQKRLYRGSKALARRIDALSEEKRKALATALMEARSKAAPSAARELQERAKQIEKIPSSHPPIPYDDCAVAMLTGLYAEAVFKFPSVREAGKGFIDAADSIYRRPSGPVPILPAVPQDFLPQRSLKHDLAILAQDVVPNELVRRGETETALPSLATLEPSSEPPLPVSRPWGSREDSGPLFRITFAELALYGLILSVAAVLVFPVNVLGNRVLFYLPALMMASWTARGVFLGRKGRGRGNVWFAPRFLRVPLVITIGAMLFISSHYGAFPPIAATLAYLTSIGAQISVGKWLSRQISGRKVLPHFARNFGNVLAVLAIGLLFFSVATPIVALTILKWLGNETLAGGAIYLLGLAVAGYFGINLSERMEDEFGLKDGKKSAKAKPKGVFIPIDRRVQFSKIFGWTAVALLLGTAGLLTRVLWVQGGETGGIFGYPVFFAAAFAAYGFIQGMFPQWGRLRNGTYDYYRDALPFVMLGGPLLMISLFSHLKGALPPALAVIGVLGMGGVQFMVARWLNAKSTPRETFYRLVGWAGKGTVFVLALALAYFLGSLLGRVAE